MFYNLWVLGAQNDYLDSEYCLKISTSIFLGTLESNILLMAQILFKSLELKNAFIELCIASNFYSNDKFIFIMFQHKIEYIFKDSNKKPTYFT